MTTKHNRTAFRSDIEGLRGLAVLLVVAFHAKLPGFGGGFIGVDVFFVLSGYLITGLLVNEIRVTGTLDLLQFYARRVRRLLPASALAVFVTMTVGVLVFSPLEQVLFARTARATALYASNFFFAVNASDYFAPDVETNPLLHMWSLAVEEQFYVIWPLLILLSLRKRSPKLLIAVMATLSLVSFAISIWLTAHLGTWAFYSSPARAWEFGLGGLASVMLFPSLRLHPDLRRAIGWLGVATILGCGTFFSTSTSFPGYIAMIPVLGTLVTLIAGAGTVKGGVGRLLDLPWLQRLGQLSYSWYLWHWPALIAASILLPHIPVMGRIIAAAASLVLARTTNRIIENPIRFNPRLMARPVLTLGLAMLLTVVSLAASFAWRSFALREAVAPRQKTLTAAAADESQFLRSNCISLALDTSVKECVFGDESSTTNITLFGDSHAAHWEPPLEQIAKDHGWRLTTLLKSGCPASDVRVFDSLGRSATQACTNWREAAIKRLAALRPTAVVISNFMGYIGRPVSENNTEHLSYINWQQGTNRTLGALVSSGIRVLVIRDVPLPGFDVPNCLGRMVEHSWYPADTCAFDRAVALDPAIFQAEQNSALGMPNVGFADLTDQFCTGGRCETVKNGIIVYRDNGHMTATFAVRLAPVLADHLLGILKRPAQMSRVGRPISFSTYRLTLDSRSINAKINELIRQEPSDSRPLHKLS